MVTASPWRADRLEGNRPDQLGDVLELRWVKIADREIEPTLDLPIGVLRQADRAGIGYAFKARGDIDAVAHQIAVAFLDHVAEMDADPKFDALVGRDPSVALDHRPLDFNGQFTASTTLRNSTMLPSTVRLTMRPWWTAMVGSIRSLRSARSRARMRSSSAPASRE